jgi:hypothetical protein
LAIVYDFDGRQIPVGSSVTFVREVQGNKLVAVDVKTEGSRHMRGGLQ